MRRVTDSSPFDGSLLGQVDRVGIRSAQKHVFYLLVQELACLGVTGIEPVVVDEQGLVLEPIAPTALTDSAEYSLSELATEWCLGELGSALPATLALDRFHVVLDTQVSSRRTGRALPGPFPGDPVPGQAVMEALRALSCLEVVPSLG